jgi:hypothetical protein
MNRILRRHLGSSAATLVLLASVAAPVADSVAGAAALPACPVYSKYPVKPVAPDVLKVVTKYFTAKHLNPIRIYKNQEKVLNVKQQWVGTHWCRNADGSKSGYTGMVPKTATAAVMVQVKHKPYPVTQAPTTFVTLAKLKTGWKVVSEGTGP